MSVTSTVVSAPAPQAGGRRSLHGLAYLSPLIVIAALLSIYLVSPDFYLTYVLEYQHREYQAVEMLTVALAAAAAALLLYASGRLGAAAWRAADTAPAHTLHQRFDRWFPTLVVLAVALACVFLVGEELSWGQTFKYWGIAERDKPVAYETNMHNNLDLPLQSVGQAFLMGIFFVLPILWALRRRLNLPGHWRTAIAEGPVIFAAAIGMAWKGVKELYVLLVGASADDRFYVDFIEQINEQKELLLALSLFLYGVYRVAASRRRASPEQ